MPFVDFAFMLIILFVGMLSIAYFEPPADAPEGPEVLEVRPLAPPPPPPPTPPRTEAGDSTRQQEIRRLRRQVEQLEQRLQHEPRLKDLFVPGESEAKPDRLAAPVPLPDPSAGLHYYTDLRTRHEEE